MDEVDQDDPAVSIQAGLQDNQSDAMRVLGFFYLQHQQISKAQCIFEALYSLVPEKTEVALSLAYTYIKMDRFQEAMELAGSVQNPNRSVPSVVHLIIARALLSLNRIAEARQHLEQYSKDRIVV